MKQPQRIRAANRRRVSAYIETERTDKQQTASSKQQAANGKRQTENKKQASKQTANDKEQTDHPRPANSKQQNSEPKMSEPPAIDAEGSSDGLETEPALNGSRVVFP
jgi:hypothetical protein